MNLSSIHLFPLNPIQGRRGLEPIPAAIGREAGTPRTGHQLNLSRSYNYLYGGAAAIDCEGQTFNFFEVGFIKKK